MACHMVPGLLSPGFVGRDDQLRWLEGRLGPGNERFVGARAGIHGLTGIGKTQLMLKYEAMYRMCYTSQLFLVASSKAKFLDSVQQASSALGLFQHHTHSSAIQGLHNWLCQTSGWLLLIDNVAYETVDLILQVLPSNAGGHTIVTSQLRGAVEKITGLSKACLALPELELDDAVDMFVAASDIDSKAMSREEKVLVVKAMGLMPHTIEQAASYLRVNHLDPGVFLARYNKTPGQTLDWDDGSSESTSKSDGGLKELPRRSSSIGKHLGLIFDTLQQTHTDALIVLKFYSLLDPESIPLFDTWSRPDWNPGFPAATITSGCLSVFLNCFRGRSARSDDGLAGEAALHPGQQLANIFRDQDKRERAIAKLCDLNLTHRIRDGRVLWMHEITKKTVQASIPAKDMEQWILAGMDVVYHMVPEKDSTAEEREWVDKCLRATRALIHQAQSLGIEMHRYICLLVLCALSNMHRDARLLAWEQFEKAKLLYEEYLGRDHPRTIAILEMLGLATCSHGGAMALSEEYCKQAWKLYEARLGPTADETLSALNKLACTIERAGKLKEAEAMFELLWCQEEQASGSAGPRTMAAAHNLALCLHNQGHLGKARVIYGTALESSDQFLGVEDPATLKTLINYAATLDHDGRFEEAQAIYDRALPSFVRVLGFDHHLTLRLRCNMAGLLRQQGSFAQADVMMRRCLEVAEKIHDADSFEMKTYLYELGEVYQAKGNVQGARDIFEKTMGQLSGDMMEHPVLFRFIDSWGTVEREMGRLEAAREKSQDAYCRFEGLLGWDNPYTLMAANDYAEVLHADGCCQEAFDLLVRCRNSFATLLGKEHQHYAMALNNLGRLCWAFNAAGDPMTFFTEARAILARRVGENHYCTATVSLNIARTKFFAGDFGSAVGAVETARKTLEGAIDTAQQHPLFSTCDTIMGVMSAARGDQDSLLKARDYMRAAIKAAHSCVGSTASADYFLAICLLILILRLLQDKSTESEIKTLHGILGGPAAKQLSPWNVSGTGKISADQFAVIDPKGFDFKAYIPLATGETFRLRWGRKTCWRKVETERL
ncbi:hypothetical protein B0T17DRAFT_557399 [Bombardia bombarda]|uniref:TPR-like protein n=1 Tax=Bombardia bombarda TaxID=252184 RepID=A0AA39WZJ9_9PEZI|nr:hypothetical protein B0T17DRAFT_557399 [Bombardia bombarda]